MNIPNDLPALSIGGISIAAGVLVLVYAASMARLVVDGDGKRKLAVVIALVLGAVWFVRGLKPEWAPVIDTAYTALIGCIGAALAQTGLEAGWDWLKTKIDPNGKYFSQW